MSFWTELKHFLSFSPFKGPPKIEDYVIDLNDPKFRESPEMEALRKRSEATMALLWEARMKELDRCLTIWRARRAEMDTQALLNDFFPSTPRIEKHTTYAEFLSILTLRKLADLEGRP